MLSFNKISANSRHSILLAHLIVVVLYLVLTPQNWNYSPDGGIYIGTSINIVENHAYYFNGHPNLRYYPGFSALLLIPISIFGINFFALHLFCVFVGLAMFWLSNMYFRSSEYGGSVWVVPFIIAANTIVMSGVFRVLSDVLFVVVVLASLHCWKSYTNTGNKYILIACLLLVSSAPMIRFHGLFLAGSLLLAILYRNHQVGNNTPTSILRASVIVMLVLCPFIAWTARNYYLYTPDTLNMANKYFFGLPGLSIYSPEHYKVDWIDEEWKYGPYHLLLSIDQLMQSYFGSFAAFIPLSVGAALIAMLLIPGALLWIRRGSVMEIAFLLMLAAFFVIKSLSSSNLYVVSRYWLPLVPHITLFGVLSYSIARQRLHSPAIRNIFTLIGVAILIVILANGLQYAERHVTKQSRYATGNALLSKAAVYITNTVQTDEVLAVTDGGILPFYLNRTSYQVLNDPNHRLSLERIRKYNARVLVVFSDAGASAPYAQRMAESYPMIFELVKTFRSQAEESLFINIYKIDNDSLRFLDKA